MSYIKVTEEMKAGNEKEAKPNKPARKKTAESDAGANLSSELSEPRWSVVSFDARLAGNLTYEQAALKMQKATAEKISGLCIITDEAAENI